MDKTNERELAIYILMDIMAESGYNNLVLRKTLNKNNALNQVQKAFITEAVNGVLRNIVLIDYILEKFSKTPTKKMKPFILNNLRVAVYQIKFMDRVPNSAACNEAVNLTKKKSFANLSGFVNGVLRSVIRSVDNIEYPSEKDMPIAYLSVKYSYPEWLTERFVSSLGYETTKDMFEVNNSSPEVTLCVNTLKTDKNALVEILKKEGVEISESAFIENAVKVSKTSDITKLKSFTDGLYHVMDESAMLAVKIAAPKENWVIIDVCAAPGGKSYYAAYLTNGKSEIIARDIYEHKMSLIEGGAQRLSLGCVKAEVYNAENFDASMEEKADLVIIDAPCSGFGLLRKKPDIKLFKEESDISDLALLQKSILTACWRYVKKGGTLLYSTCTLTKEENIDNLNWFSNHFPFEAEDISPNLPKNMEIETAQNGYITILPQYFKTDGFFIARFVRKDI